MSAFDSASLEGMYTIQFAGPDSWGAGILVLETGKLYGGDSWLAYIGTYTVENGTMTAKARVTRHSPGGQSIFGPMFDAGHPEFTVVIQGPVNSDEMILSGFVEGSPNETMQVQLKFHADLP